MSEDPEEIVGVYKQVTEDGLVWTTEIYRWQESRVAEILTMMRELGPVDPNATAGTWPEVIRLEHSEVLVEPASPWGVEPTYTQVVAWTLGEGLGVLVPVFAGDPERAVWRRRRWWGRGPIVFDPYGYRWPAAVVDVRAFWQ